MDPNVTDLASIFGALAFQYCAPLLIVVSNTGNYNKRFTDSAFIV